ncbi:hypothetical protein ACFPRA_20475 [Sporosarcina soli]|uniref:Uncharacterized protein n=1 Tax=Sporosarcina soli TaxID=334736 RepID=A0ABW0TPZ7_9BACL
MYKRIGTFNFSTYSSIPEIDNIVNDFASKALDELKNSIYEQYVLRNFGFEFSEVEKSWIRNVLEENAVFELDIPNEMALMVLSQILKIEMEEFLRVPFNKFDDNSSEKVDVLFKDFEVGDSTINFIDVNTISQREVFSSYPTYFKLYRARNGILKKFNQRYYSSKTLSELVRNIYEEFKQGLYTICLNENYQSLSQESLENILKKVINEYILQILNGVKLGKTMEDGEREANKIEQIINAADIKTKIFNSYSPKFKSKFSDTFDSESYVKLAEELIEIIENYLNELSLSTEKICIERYSDYRMIVLGEIFRNSQDVLLLIANSIDIYSGNLKSETVKKVLNDNLAINDFQIALRVENLAIDEKIYKKLLTEDIEVISHPMFLSWQSGIYDKLGGQQKPTFIDIPDSEKDNSVWFLVNGVSCGKKDTELAYSFAKDKLVRYLEVLYYFVSSEDEYNFKIVDPYILFNKTSGSLLLGRKESGHKRTKKVDDFSNELFSFLNKLLSSPKKISNNLKQCINLYYQFINSEEIFTKAKLLVSILEIIFDVRDDKKLAFYSAIIIAGTNYSSNTEKITYKTMREILYWDLIEFIEAARDESYLLMLEETIDRIKVFVKNILGTYIYNIPWENGKEDDITDILCWILHINPENEYIYHGGVHND